MAGGGWFVGVERGRGETESFRVKMRNIILGERMANKRIR